MRDQRDFAYIRYHIVNRRIRTLERQGYVEKSGEKKTKTGFAAILYQMTNRAHLAALLNKINLDDFIEKAPEYNILGALRAFTLTSGTLSD